jgi:uncharacterized protein YkwD
MTRVVALALAALAVPQAASADPMIERINAVRADHGLRPLQGSERLARSARRHAGRLMEHGSFGHGALRLSGFSSLGEALAYHRGRRLAVARTVRRWLGSAVHRGLVLDPSFRWAGAGRSSGRFGGRRATIWVLRLGRR